MKKGSIDAPPPSNFAWRSVLHEVFPNQTRIKADWLTDLLVLPDGKTKDYIRTGYGLTYEKNVLLEIDKGNVTKMKKLKDGEFNHFRDQQFKAFKKTEEYKKMVNIIKEDDPTESENSIDQYLKRNITDYTTKILEE